MSEASNLTRELAAMAASLIADEGLDWASAKRKAAKALNATRDMPSNELVEDQLREHLAIYHAETQPVELAAMRALALGWMNKLAAHRPHLAYAVWRGTATRRSRVIVELYADNELYSNFKC